MTSGMALVLEAAAGLAVLLAGVWWVAEGLGALGGQRLARRLSSRSATDGRALRTGLVTALLLPGHGTASSSARALSVSDGVTPSSTASFLMSGLASSVMLLVCTLPIAAGYDLSPIGFVLVGLGVCLRWTPGLHSATGWDRGLAGWGLVLLGLQFLGHALVVPFAGPLSTLNLPLPMQLTVVPVVAALAAVFLRSSAAALAALAFLAAAGSVPMAVAVAASCGALIGGAAESLPALSAGAARARRGAAIQITVHVLAGVIGLVLAMCAMPLWSSTQTPLARAGALVVHHAVSVSCALLFAWSLRKVLLGMLSRRWIEEESQPAPTLAETAARVLVPEIEVVAAETAMRGAGLATCEYATALLSRSSESASKIERIRERATLALEHAEPRVMRLAGHPLPEHLAPVLLDLPRALALYRSLLDWAETLVSYAAVPSLDKDLTVSLVGAELAVRRVLERCTPRRDAATAAQRLEALQSAEESFAGAEASLLKALADGRLSVALVRSLLERLNASAHLVECAADAVEALTNSNGRTAEDEQDVETEADEAALEAA